MMNLAILLVSDKTDGVIDMTLTRIHQIRHYAPSA